jgi:cytochrome c nitrite reductase small subunit
MWKLRRQPGARWAGLSLAALLLCVLIGVTVGAGGFTFIYGQGFSYLSNDPRACVNCHIMRDHYDGWQHSSHHAVATCNDCHVPHALIPKYLSKAENGFWHSKGFTLQDFHEPIRIRAHNSQTLQHNCIDCHERLVGEILGQEGHSVDEWSCVHCHQNVGHGPVR